MAIDPCPNHPDAGVIRCHEPDDLDTLNCEECYHCLGMIGTFGYE